MSRTRTLGWNRSRGAEGMDRDLREGDRELGGLSWESGFCDVLLDVMSDSIKIVSRERRILFVNRSAARLLNLSRQDLVGQLCHEVFSGAAEPCVFCRVDEVFETGREKRYSLWVERKEDRDQRFLEFSLYPLRDESDSVRWVAEITRDLTEVKKAADRVAFEEKLAFLGEISARVAEAMKNPVSALLTASKVLSGRPEDLTAEEKETLAAIVREEGVRLQGLLRDLLSVGSRQPPQRTFLDPADLADEVVSAIRNSPVWPEGVQCKVESLPRGRRVFADPEQIRQALWHVLENALEAAGSRGRVAVRMELEKDAVRWVVADSGPGIPADFLPFIFDPFRSSKRDKRGLGLTLAKSIVDVHGGDIEVQSLLGKGTTVSLRLPLAR